MNADISGVTMPCVTMTVGGQMFGVSTEHVTEIFVPREITPIPLAPSWVLGALNLRGRIVTTVSMRRKLGLPDAPGPGMAIVLDHKGEVYSLLVDSVGEVRRIDTDAVEPNPPNLEAAWLALSDGVVPLEDGLLALLHFEGLFARSDREVP